MYNISLKGGVAEEDGGHPEVHTCMNGGVHAHCSGMYTLVESTHWWSVHTGGVYTLVECTHWWNVHTGGVYTLVECTHRWSVHTGGVQCNGITCSNAVHISSSL